MSRFGSGSHIGTVGCVAFATSVVRVGRLVMSRAKITIGRAGYYTEVVAKGLDDYLSGAGEAPGVWAGAGTAFESVVGLVGADQMQRLFEPADPCHPVTGNPLGASYAVRDGVDKVSGWDLTLSAPKSFSSLWAVADPDLPDARRLPQRCGRDGDRLSGGARGVLAEGPRRPVPGRHPRTDDRPVRSSDFARR